MVEAVFYYSCEPFLGRSHVKWCDPPVSSLRWLEFLSTKFTSMVRNAQLPGLVNQQKTMENCPFIVDLPSGYLT